MDFSFLNPDTVTDDTPATAKRGAFDDAFVHVAKTEGGYVANDAGKGETKFGINSHANPDVDIRGLTPEGAKRIYKERYWDAIDADSLPPGMQLMAFDAAVNQGVGRAKQWLRQAGDDPQEFLRLRRQHYQDLTAVNPQKYGPYAKAWESRLAGLGGGTAQQASSNDEWFSFLKSAPAYLPPKAAEPEKPSEGFVDNFKRGLSNYLPQLKATGNSAEAMLGAAAKKAGLDGVGDWLIGNGLEGLDAAQKQIQGKETDSFSSVLDAKGQGFGAWAGNALGQLTGNLAEMGVTAAAGTFIGALAGSPAPGAGNAAGGASGLLAGLVAKDFAKRKIWEAGAEVAKKYGQDAALRFYRKEAGKMVGVNAAVLADATFHGAGETANQVIGEARKNGVDLSQVDVGRWALSVPIHAGLEFVGDKVLLHGLGGEGAYRAAGTGWKPAVKTIAGNAGKVIAGEVPTEVGQTAVERYAAGQDLTDEDARRDYVDSAAAAATFGIAGVPGGVRAHLYGDPHGSAHAGDGNAPGVNAVPDPLAEAAAKPNSPLSRAAVAGREPDAISQRAAAIEQQVRDGNLLETLRSIGNPNANTTHEFLDALAVARNPSVPQAVRQQALDSLEMALGWIADGKMPFDPATGKPFSTALTVPPVPGTDLATQQGGPLAPAGQGQWFDPNVVDVDAVRVDNMLPGPRALPAPQRALGAPEGAQAQSTQDAGWADAAHADENAAPEAPAQAEPAPAAAPESAAFKDVPMPAVRTPAGEGTAESRRKAAQLRALAEDGFTTVEREGNAHYLVNHATRQRVRLDNALEAQRARHIMDQRVEALARTAAAHPESDRADPTPAQAEAGNYKKSDTIKIAGLGVRLENPAGSVRRGVDKDGNPWENKLQFHYGDIVGIPGADGDKMDAFVGPDPTSGRIFVIDQLTDGGAFDEHKVMLGFRDEAEARAGYMANYDEGWTGLGAITEMTPQQFRLWARSPAGTLPAAGADLSQHAGGRHGRDARANPGEDRSAGARLGEPAESAVQDAGTPDAQRNRDAASAADRDEQLVADFARAEHDQTLRVAPRTPESDALRALLHVAERTFGVHGIAIETKSNKFDGAVHNGTVFVNVRDPAMHVAQTIGHELAHTQESDLQHLRERLWSLIGEQGRRRYFEQYLFPLKDGHPAYAHATPEQLAKLKSEMLADFMGNRFNDPAWLKSLAERRPHLFGQFVRDWLRLLDTLIGGLKNMARRMSPDSVKNVDRYIQELERAKAIAANIATVWAAKYPRMAKGTGAEAALRQYASDQRVAADDTTAGRVDETQENEHVAHSRREATRAAYEARIDELFAGKEASLTGVLVLERSDPLSLLGYADKPVLLAEGKVRAGFRNHPRMNAAAWKRVPEWIENPAAVFESETDGGLVFIGPEPLGGAPVSIIVRPDADGGLAAHLLLNAYDHSSTTPFKRWIDDGLLRYADTKKFPALIEETSGRRLPGTALQNKPGTRKILTEKNLAGWRKEHQVQYSARPATEVSEADWAEFEAALAQLDSSTPEFVNGHVSAADIAAEGMMAEEALGALRWSAEGNVETAELPGGEAAEIVPTHDGVFTVRGLRGTYLTTPVRSAAREYATRQVAARRLAERGFDLASTEPADVRAHLASEWRAVAGKAAETGAQQFGDVKDASRTLRSILGDLGLPDNWQAGVTVDRNPEGTVVVVEFENTQTAEVQSAFLDITTRDGRMVATANTTQMRPGGLGTLFYQAASEYLARKNIPLAPDDSVSGINAYRRTEQMISAALRTGRSTAMLPHVAQRVYGFNERASTQGEHDENLSRLLIAGLRNVREVAPEVGGLTYHPETGAFADRAGNDAQALVDEVLARPLSRTFGLGHGTLARAALTQQALAGGSIDVESFDSPVLYSKRADREKVRIGLSAATDSILGIKALYERAGQGDDAAAALLQDVAHDALAHLLAGTSAQIKRERATGLFWGEVEPSVGVTLTFDAADRPAVLAGLARFADNFNQIQVHVRGEAKGQPGARYDDGSYNTRVYRWGIERPLGRREIQRIIDESGLPGLTFGDSFVETYFVGNPNDQAAYQDFIRRAEHAGARILGEAGGRVRRTTARLWNYGRGDGAIDYGQIRGDVQAGPVQALPTARRVAEYLNAEGGHPTRVKTFDQAATISPRQRALQRKIARAYEALPDNDLQNPDVTRAYEALSKEVLRQFKALPVKVEVLTGQGEPYANSDAMRRDLADNNHLYIFGTTADTFGPPGEDFSGHPLLGNSGLKDQNGHPLLFNDLLRAVHDYYAHAMSPTQFGPKGEEAAWKNHMAMTRDPWARWALTTETRGQNSWVNFNAGLDAATPIKDRPFARQKAALIPAEYMLTGNRKVDEPARAFIAGLPEASRQGSAPKYSRRISEEQRAANLDAFRDDATVVTSAQADAHQFKTGEAVMVDAFHGTQRPDRVGTTFNPKRATSGPMAFFTSSPALASNYAQGKTDTSLPDDLTFGDWFKVKLPGMRRAVSIDRAWYDLAPEQRQTVRERLSDIREDDDGNIVHEDGGGDPGSYRDELRAKNGNALAAAVETWLSSGNLIRDEQRFMDVLRLAGMPMQHVEFDPPNASYPAVYKTHIRMRNPLVTSDIPAEVRSALEQAAKSDRSRTKPGADMWDKRGRTLRNWWSEFNNPHPSVAAYAWTSIPDKVTDILKAHGYDGIIDWSGKGGGEQHPVYIPFGPTQIKSAMGNRGTFDPESKNILYSRREQTETPEFKRWFGDWETAGSVTRADAQIRQSLAGELAANVIIDLGRPSAILAAHGVPDLPMTLRQSILRKAADGKHGVDRQALQGLARAIQSPLAIFDDPDHSGTRVALTEIRASDGNVIAAIRLNVQRDGLEVNDIRSVHPKRDDSVLRWVEAGLLLGLEKKKGRQWLENLAATNSRQPQAMTALADSILYDGDSFDNVSKVVDAEGRPLVLYHGTRADFGTFGNVGGRFKDLSKGFYFTSSANRASVYADSLSNAAVNWRYESAFAKPVEDGANVMPVYVRIVNPLHVSDRDGFNSPEDAFDAKGGVLVESAKQLGHDGIIFRREKDDGYDEVAAVVFDPSQVKSAIGNSGQFDPANPDIRYSRRPDVSPLGLYSELTRKVEESTMRQAPAGAWKLYIKALTGKGVKQDEITWSGVEDWLELQQGKVPREAVIEFLRGNGVQVEETVLGAVGDELPAGWRVEEEEDDPGLWSVRDAQGIMVGQAWGRAEAMRDAGVRDRRTTSNAQYGQYTLPGGKNYREVLLTLPVQPANTAGWTVKPGNGDPASGPVWEVRDSRGKWVIGLPRGDVKTEADALRIASTRYRQHPSTYKSGHWGGEYDNILAHLRVSDRVDADGRRVLLVDEVQSDWGQDGKRQGFRQSYGGKTPKVTAKVVTGREFVAERSMPAAVADAWLAGRNDMRRDMGERQVTLDDEFTVIYEDGVPKIVRDGRQDAEAEARQHRQWYEALVQNARQRHNAEQAGRVPPAPFVTKTDGWLNLALKRAFIMAVDGDYDAVAFVSGQQSADRYDLRKQVDSIDVERYDLPSVGPVADIRVIGLDGNSVHSEDGASMSRVADLIGKELAERIAQQKPETRQQYAGDDLKVGGKGMIDFYDKIVPNAVKALLKKVGGEGMTTIQIDGASTQPGFVVTDKIRESVSGGMPMFSKRMRDGDLDADISRPAARHATTFAEAREQAKAFQGKDLINAATGLVGRVSRNSLDKMLSEKAVGKSVPPTLHSAVVANVDHLFERGVAGWSKPDDAGNQNIARVHRFFAPLNVDGRALLAKLTVKETVDANHANPIYSVEAVEFNEKSPAAQWVDASAAADGVDLTSTRSAGDVRILAQRVQDFNDGVRYSTRSTVGDNGRAYTPEQRAMFEHTGRTVDEPTIIERVKAFRKDMGKKLAQGIVDQFRPIRDLDKRAYSLARLSKGAAGAFEALLHHGKLKITDGVYDADTSGGFMEQVAKPLGAELDDFVWWVAANRAERLAGEGRENLFSPEDIAAGKSLASGQMAQDYTLANGQTTRDRALAYADALKKLDAFNKNVLDMAEQSGLIDGATRPHWDNEFYVPFYRVSEEDGGFIGDKIKGGLARQRAFKELKGGAQKLHADLVQNMLQNWAHLIDAAAKNRAAKETMEAALGAGIALEASQDMVRQLGKQVGGGVGTAWFMDGGQQRHFLIEDPYLLEAINSLSYAGLKGPMMTALSQAKHWLTVGVTASPGFKVRNLIRDSLQAIATADLGYNPFANLNEGRKLTAKDAAGKHDPLYVSALASGGLIRFGSGEASQAQRMRRLLQSGVPAHTVLNSPARIRAFFDQNVKPALDWYEELGSRGEEINRAALYAQLVKKGMSPAEAALQARDLMDFSMQGTWGTIRFLTQVVPFLNARLQGLYKLGRAAQEDPRRFSMVLGATALASIALMAAYSDDDDWKKREDWDRDGYWWFKLFGVAWRIPKPFELGAIASVAERGVELFTNDDFTAQRFLDRVKHLAGDNLSMNPIPQALKPILDVYANVDSFSGRPIESMGMERLQAEYRFNAHTSMVARGASTAMNTVSRNALGMETLSPVQVDHLLRAYFGWLGTFSVAAADAAIRPLTNEPGRPSLDYMKVVTQGLAATVPADQSKYVSAIYAQSQELDRVYATYRQLIKDGKATDAAHFAAENADMLRRQKLVAQAKKIITESSQRVRAIERSPTMDGDEKRDRISREKAIQSDAARRVY